MMEMNVATKLEKIDVKISLVPYGTSVYREEISTVASQPQRNQQVKYVFSAAANLNNRFVPLE
jgi:hypothetical protein